MHLLADLSRAQCSWAKVYYDQVKARGKTHAQALRCLGQRWLNIIYRMWQDHTLYNGAMHTKNQLQHGSWVLQITPRN